MADPTLSQQPSLGELAQAIAWAELALAASQADETEITIHEQIEASTRFAAEGITQNVLTCDGSLTVRAVLGARTGRASTTSFDEHSIRRAAGQALAAARVASEDPAALPLVQPGDIAPPTPEAPGQGAPATVTPEEDPDARAMAVVAAATAVRKHGLRPAGTATTSVERLVIANSRGLRASWQGATAGFALTASGGDGSGWAEQVASMTTALDRPRATAIAIDKALRSAAPVDLEPGSYTVLLEPAAVIEFLQFLGHLTFSGLACNEGRSSLSGKLGTTLFSPLVSVHDDAHHALAQGPVFDYEGVPRRTVTLIDRGVAVAVVHDRRSAKAAGVSSTGHALAQPNTFGPIAQNLVLAAGESTFEQMLASTAHGVLVSRFHYTNVLDPMTMMLTGMTRDGTFLIEDGKVTRGLKNLRFAHSALELLARVEMVGRDLELHRALFGGGCIAPAIKVSGFQFTSASGF